MAEIIRVGIAECKTCIAPDLITTIGLGSCIGIVLYNIPMGICGMVHIMLPDSSRIKDNTNRAKFADTGIDLLIEELGKLNIPKNTLNAKIAGGAKMFEFSSTSELGSIGNKNIEAVHNRLDALNIPIKASDCGLNYGRTIVFNPVNQELEIVKAGKQRKVI